MPEDFNILLWILVGFIAGALAGWFVPGRERYGCLGTILVGIAGGLLGGWLWTEVFGQPPATGFLGAILIATLGAALVILVIRAISGRR